MSDISMNSLLAQMRALTSQAVAERPSTEAPAVQPQFSQMLSRAIDAVNESQTEAADLKSRFQLGQDGIDITQVMVASQKANVEFQLMVQVRNKLVNAYQEIMNMQI